MSATTSIRHAVAALGAGVLLLAPTAVVVAATAHADCTGAGDFGAGSGCPPPGDTSGSGGSPDDWPPTGVDWPPSQSSDSSDSAGGSGGGGGGGQATPIVMPDGQTAPTKAAHPADSSSTSTPPTPIVPAGAAAPATKPTVIVAASP